MPVQYSSFGAALRPLGRQFRRRPQLSAPPPSITERVNVANNASRNFTTSHNLRTGRQEPEHHKNHYETLNVHFDATQADIKKSFYHLSKAHHPDHNPSDPHSAHRFMRISEAYSILSHSDKRARYDRDVLRLHLRARAHGSHHSSSVGPAGGRPASGLSKRRSTTQGAPPPSFFKQGGYGESKAKREREKQRAAETGYPQGGFAGFGANQTGTGNGTAPGQGGRKEWSRAFDPSTAPHFDSQQHTRTHEQVWENLKRSHARRQAAARKQQDAQHQQYQYPQYQGQEEEQAQTQGGKKRAMPEVQQGNWTSFFVVTGVLMVSSFGPYWLFGEWTTRGGGGKSNGGGGGSRKQAAAA
ncbi:hypothetical protein QBC32DRAFT_329409 [Pseudoneurospora amorphoporcata]|uniref:DnaJ homolog subfamily C member 30, mitochondrial n=1 Tax=Pseudoneurospora amorphoporcata TaxID=241081 RepID=A0AAN6P3F7_9PEZI|nr:hypothetical protein QBC32DRAFT_329409 [Pseudoneurospora amorphoporcata]